MVLARLIKLHKKKKKKTKMVPAVRALNEVYMGNGRYLAKIGWAKDKKCLATKRTNI